MTRAAVVAAGLAAVATVACRPHDVSGDTQADVLATWLPANALAAWQGAWTARVKVEPGSAWTPVRAELAIAVTGTTARVTDGATEHVLDVVIDRPCAITFRERQGDGSTQDIFLLTFVLDGGHLVAGVGAAGYRRDRAAVVCAAGEEGIYAVAAGGTGCTAYQAGQGAPGICAWAGEVLRVGTAAAQTVLTARGDLLESEAFAASVRAVDVVRAVRYPAP